MPQSQPSSFIGPALFFGLIIYTLLSQNMVPVSYLDPGETMDMAAATHPDTLAKAAKPIAAYALPPGPVRRQPRPARLALAPTTGPRDYARVTHPAPTTRKSVVDGQTPVTLARARVGAALDATIPTFDTPGPVAARSQPLPSATADVAIAAPIHDWVIISGDFVNLRSGPGVTFASLAQVNTGARALRADINGRWSQVSFLTQNQRLSGWIASIYLRTDRP